MTPVDFQIRMMDAMRRNAGRVADLMGDAPQESVWEEVTRISFARLRFYGGEGPPVLIVPAPFKRAYIWDLMPEVSPIQAALDAGLRVYMLEWLLPKAQEPDRGLADYALDAPEAAVSEVLRHSGARRVSLMGHSLGGTFAAIFAALRPDLVAQLALIDAPLAFGEDGGPLAQGVRHAPDVRLLARAFDGPLPGTAINTLSAAAAPDAFVLQRWLDLLASRPDRRARALHRRVMRWTLDEFPLPQRLFVEISEDLYRHDRFRAGTLKLRGEEARLAALRAPVLAVINPPGRVVPVQSVLAGLAASACGKPLILSYRAEPGPALQHLGPLVGFEAHRVLWPKITRWLSR